MLGGAHGKLLDADHDRLGMADVQGFEMEELMHSPPPCKQCCATCSPASTNVLTAPTLLILDEAWLFLDEPSFAARIRQWLKTLRKRTSASSLPRSRWPTSGLDHRASHHRKLREQIFLPNPQATEPQIRTIYEGFGEQPPD